MKPKPGSSPSFHLRFRVLLGKEIALGPGKVDLLRLVKETGSISEAARRMKMSYMRAWSLIQTMNRCFKEPVIVTTRGGRERGGASLSKTGERVLELSEQLQKECLDASAITRKKIGLLLNSGVV